MSVTPAKAGTEAKPRAARLQLGIEGEIDAAAIVVYFPTRLRITNAGLPQCAESDEQILAGACDRAGPGAAPRRQAAARWRSHRWSAPTT